MASALATWTSRSGASRGPARGRPRAPLGPAGPFGACAERRRAAVGPEDREIGFEIEIEMDIEIEIDIRDRNGDRNRDCLRLPRLSHTNGSSLRPAADLESKADLLKMFSRRQIKPGVGRWPENGSCPWACLLSSASPEFLAWRTLSRLHAGRPWVGPCFSILQTASPSSACRHPWRAEGHTRDPLAHPLEDGRASIL